MEAADRNRKYAKNTLYGIKAALKLYADELNSDEKTSFELFKKRYDQISQDVYNKNQTKISAQTFETYKSRLWKFISDYEKYGKDPSKMATWNPPRRRRKSTSKDLEKNRGGKEDSELLKDHDKEMGMSLPLSSGLVIQFPEPVKDEVAFGRFGKQVKDLEDEVQKVLEEKKVDLMSVDKDKKGDENNNS